MKIDPPPVTINDEGTATLEEDMVTGGGVRLWRTLLLFREELPLIVIGFIIVFVQVAMSAFIPQLTQSYQEAMFVPCSHCATSRIVMLLFSRFCADNYANALDGEFLKIFKLNPSILKSRSAFSYEGNVFRCVSDDSLIGLTFDCACSGPSSDIPTSVRSTFINFLPPAKARC